MKFKKQANKYRKMNSKENPNHKNVDLPPKNT